MTSEIVAPSGTVTFLFTDIEGSSARWEAAPRLMAQVLERHDQILVDAISGAGGFVFKHLGDGVCAAFSSAGAAVGAAVAAQRALGAEKWLGSEALTVRMGLHTGACDPAGGDYLGPPVNRAARVMDAAHGGQIAASSSTVSLCEGLEGIGWLDQGIVALRGVGEEHLFTLAADGLDRPGRALRVTGAGSTLPIDSTSFVGRGSDVAELAEALSGQRLVTLFGVGGVGKTRLAQETAAVVADGFAGGAWWCDLAPVLDGDAMTAAVAQVVGARAQPGVSLAAAVAGHLERRDVLLVLDNCEHVIGEVGDLVEELLAVEGVTVLATSREPLGLRAEQVWAVRSLDADESGITLFVDRAVQRNRNFSISEEEREAVREVCRRLDGIPLAIELAAARTRSMSVVKILERIDDRFRLLRGGRRSERHQTLRDAVNWSFELLEEPEAALFERLSVFAGDFSLEAVESVCVDGSIVDSLDVVDLLEALVDKSMLVASHADGNVRYRLLETLRQFAEEQLDRRGDTSRFRLSHLGYYHDIAAELAAHEHSPDEPVVWAAYSAEWDNLRLAHSTALATGDLPDAADVVVYLADFILEGQRFEGADWAEAILAAEGAAKLTLHADICGIAALGAFIRHGADRAIELARQGLDSDPANRFCRNAILNGGIWSGDRVLVAECLDEWSRLLDGSRDPLARLYYHWGRAMQGHSADVLSHADAAARVADDIASPTARSLSLWTRSFALRDSDEIAAIAALEEMASVAAQVSPKHLSILNARMYQADLAVRALPTDEALRYCRDALEDAIDQHHLAGVYWVLENTARALQRAGHTDRALQLVDHIETVSSGRPSVGRLRHQLADAKGDPAGQITTAELTRHEAQQLALATIDTILDPPDT